MSREKGFLPARFSDTLVAHRIDERETNMCGSRLQGQYAEAATIRNESKIKGKYLTVPRSSAR